MKNKKEEQWITDDTIVAIICKKHGEFLMKAGKHLRGYGCPKCEFEDPTLLKRTKARIARMDREEKRKNNKKQ